MMYTQTSMLSSKAVICNTSKVVIHFYQQSFLKFILFDKFRNDINLDLRFT